MLGLGTRRLPLNRLLGPLLSQHRPPDRLGRALCGIAAIAEYSLTAVQASFMSRGEKADRPRDDGRSPGWATNLVGAAVIDGVVRRWATIEEDREVPRLVKGNPRAPMLAARADELIESGKTDRAIVLELVRMSNAQPSDLKTASAWARQDGRWTELERPNHVVRLLDAAATNQSVEPPFPEHARRFVVLGRLAALPPNVAFDELKASLPELAQIEATIRAAAERDRAEGLGERAGFDSWRSMRRRLRSIVGPEADTEGMVIRSLIARDVAWAQLAEATRPT